MISNSSESRHSFLKSIMLNYRNWQSFFQVLSVKNLRRPSRQIHKGCCCCCCCGFLGLTPERFFPLLPIMLQQSQQLNHSFLVVVEVVRSQTLLRSRSKKKIHCHLFCHPMTDAVFEEISSCCLILTFALNTVLMITHKDGYSTINVHQFPVAFFVDGINCGHFLGNLLSRLMFLKTWWSVELIWSDVHW